MGILREVFGASKSEIWEQLAKEIGAEYIDDGFFKGEKVQARHKNWIITLDIYAPPTPSTTPITFTRMRAPYVNKDGFRFEVYRRTLLSSIYKLFGGQKNIETGFRDIDNEFIVKANDTAKVKELFSNEKIRELLSFQPEIHFKIKDDEGVFGEDFPEGVDELYFEVIGVIKDIERLRNLYELFSETLNQLCLIGSAYENDPHINL